MTIQQYTDQVKKMDRTDLENCVLECGLAEPVDSYDPFEEDSPMFPALTDEALQNLLINSVTEESIKDIEPGTDLADFSMGN